jgi:hypothetical protein
MANEATAAAVAKAEGSLAALVEAGQSPPDDLQATTAFKVAAIKDMYQSQYDRATERFELPAELQDALGVDLSYEGRVRLVTNAWLEAIIKVQTEGGY